MLMELDFITETSSFIIVILSPEPPNSDMTLLLHDIAFIERVRYFVGTAKDSTDLSRIRAEWANAIYIVEDTTEEPFLRNLEDSAYLSCIVVNNYLTKYWLLQNDSTSPLARAYSSCISCRAARAMKPTVIAKLGFTAKNKQLLLQKQYIDVVVSAQELKYTLIGYAGQLNIHVL